MKAIVYSKKGTPDKLTLREIDKPVPNDNEVLIRVHVVSLNAAAIPSKRVQRPWNILAGAMQPAK